MKSVGLVALMVLLVLVTLVGYYWFRDSVYYDNFLEWGESHVLLLLGVIVLLKILSVLWPVFPGSLFTAGSTVVVPWYWAGLADLLGLTIGATIAYLLGRKYGYSILEKFFDKKTIDKLRKLDVIDNREFEAVVVVRILYDFLSEVISWGASLAGVGLKPFILGTLVAGIIKLPIFYFSERILQGQQIGLSAGMIVVAIVAGWLLKDRYFKIEDES